MTDLKPSPGTQGLVLNESLIFERSSKGRAGFKIPPLEVPIKNPTRYARQSAAELPEVSELDVVRHFTRLSSWNYSIDSGTFPLGSCTMKYNPRINEEVAAYHGLADIHPELPVELAQGALEVVHRLERILSEISGLDDCSVQPAAGAHGEFTGLSIIRSFHEKHGSSRKIVLIPDSAHGTNPASSVLAGYTAVTLKSGPNGIVTPQSVRDAIDKYGRDIAAFMLTNPNTLGQFESHILEIAEQLHSIGAQVYMDGANMNAILGIAKPGAMGVDVMQFNLHKTFSTPHGGGGPGAGPVAVRDHLSPYLPSPRVQYVDGKYSLASPPESIGRVKGSLGNFGVAVRALCYILHNGSEGLRQVSRAAVLNANYVRSRLSKYFDPAREAPSFHECVLTDTRQQKKGVKTLQVAKRLIDEGFHPPTIYFPLVVSGAMLIEPTETESLQELDIFIDAMIRIAIDIESGDVNFDQNPRKTIVGKVDETLAARNPILSLDDRSR